MSLFFVERQAGKLMIPVYAVVFGLSCLTQMRIETEFTVTVANAPSTRSLIG